MSFLSYQEMFLPVVLLRVNCEPADELMRRRLNFQFMDKFGKKDEFRISFSDHDRQISDGAFLQPDDIWEIRWGYFHDLARVRVATLKGWQPNYNDGFPIVTCRLVVSRGRKKKHKKCVYGTEPHRVSASRNWGVMDSSEIAKKIARRHRLEAKVQKSVDASRGVPFIQPSNVSDYEYLNTLAADIDFEFFIEDSKLFYRAKPYEERPRRVFFYHPEENNSLLLSFRPEVKIAPVGKSSKNANTKGVTIRSREDFIKISEKLAKEGNFFAQGALELVKRGWPVDIQNEVKINLKREEGKSQQGCEKKPAHKGNVPSGNPPTEGGYDPKLIFAVTQAVLDLKGSRAGRIALTLFSGGYRTETAGPGAGRFKVSGLGGTGKLIEFEPEGAQTTAETDKDKRDCVTAAAYRKLVDKAVTARAEFIGSPTIRSRGNYSVFNVGKRFSGKWYAKDSTHNISADNDYKVSLEFKRGTLKNTRGPKAKSKDDKKKDEQKEQKPREGFRVQIQNGRRVDFVTGNSVPST